MNKAPHSAVRFLCKKRGKKLPAAPCLCGLIFRRHKVLEGVLGSFQCIIPSEKSLVQLSVKSLFTKSCIRPKKSGQPIIRFKEIKRPVGASTLLNESRIMKVKQVG